MLGCAAAAVTGSKTLVLVVFTARRSLRRARGSPVIFNLTTVFVVLGAFWLIGATAGVLWWVKGVEARRISEDVLSAPAASLGSVV
jgi:hypothetical protein